MKTSDPMVEDIRHASRQLVRELGFMRPTLAGSDLPPSAVHALIEIDQHGPTTAARLAQALNLEKSSVSRLLGKLLAQGEITEQLNPEDGREKRLTLTRQGRKTVAALHAFGRKQVAAALGRIPRPQQHQVLSGLSAYGQALAADRLGIGATPAAGQAVIQPGYRPTALGRIIEMHAAYYSQLAGFGQFFECKVASELATFVSRLEGSKNGLWLALQGQRVLGSVAIDVETGRHPTGHLRWFILDEDARGLGLGRQLLAAALDHCDRLGLKTSYLWTFSGLDAARHLYESAGFRLVKELRARQWGQEVSEQKFVRKIGASR